MPCCGVLRLCPLAAFVSSAHESAMRCCTCSPTCLQFHSAVWVVLPAECLVIAPAAAVHGDAAGAGGGARVSAQVLASTKAKANDVKEKLRKADEARRSINEKRDQYRPVAVRGSCLYFAIIDLSSVNCMYQTSLNQVWVALFPPTHPAAHLIKCDAGLDVLFCG